MSSRDVLIYLKHQKFDEFKYIIGMYSVKGHWNLCLVNMNDQIFYYDASYKAKSSRFSSSLSALEKWNIGESQSL